MVEEPRWRKSRRSSGGDNCVEFARLADLVAVRDSKDPAGPTLRFSGKAWRVFVEGLKRDDLA